MAISFIGAASANADTVDLPSHQAGDLFICAAYNNNAATRPNTPDGWVSVVAASSASNAILLSFRIAGTASEVSGTWTEADQLIIVVYRSENIMHVGNSSLLTFTAGIGGTITYPAVTRGSPITNLWHGAVVAHQSNNTDINVAPTGMVNRSAIAGGSAGELAIHDTNANSAVWNATHYTLTSGTSSSGRVATYEIRESSFVIPTGSGGGLLLPRSMDGGYAA